MYTWIEQASSVCDKCDRVCLSYSSGIKSDYRKRIERTKSQAMHVIDRIKKLSSGVQLSGVEFNAGLASFLTMSYILVLNPQIVSLAGLDYDRIFLATCVISGVGNLLLGFVSGLPMAIAPAMGLNTFFVYSQILDRKYSAEKALTTCFCASFLMLLLGMTRRVKKICSLLPQDVRSGIVVGLGLLLTMIGLQHMGVVVPSPFSMVQLGPVTLPLCYGCAVLAAMMGLGETSYKYTTVTCVLVAAVIHMIHTKTFPEWSFNAFDFNLQFFIPTFDFSRFDPWFFVDILTYTTVLVFDSGGTVESILAMTQVEAEAHQVDSLYAINGLASMAAAILGIPPLIVHAECIAGVGEGGRTGGTAIYTGAFFLLSIFLQPLLKAIPIFITSPALVPIGLILINETKRIDFGNKYTGYAAFFAIIMQPFTVSISNGIYVGVALYLISLAAYEVIDFVHGKKQGATGASLPGAPLREPLVHA